MNNYFRFFLFVLVIFSGFSCSDERGREIRYTSDGKRLGGKIILSSIETYQTLFPLSVADKFSADLIGQVYEGLVKLDPQNLQLVPAIAQSWSVDSSKTVYTFHLRKKVFFHNDECFPEGKGREVKASDFKYSFELLCSQRPDNNTFSVTFKNLVKGANQFYEQSVRGVDGLSIDGVKVIDDYTLQLILEKPSISFLYTLAQPATVAVPKEAVERYGEKCKIGSGPFVFGGEGDSGRAVYLVRNPHYYLKDKDGNQLPYLDTVLIRVYGTEKSALMDFLDGRLDVINRIPSGAVSQTVSSHISDFKGKRPRFILDQAPQMTTHFYEFITQAGIFKNRKVRQAFSYAIDRKSLAEGVLKGEVQPGIYGIVPPAFPGYDNTRIKGYTFDPVLARQYLAEAGYPDGKGFPKVTVELNSGGSRNVSVALEIQKQLKENLNVNLELNIVSFQQKINDARLAKGDLFRSSWIADYPNPISFLYLLYGKTVPARLEVPSYPNISRYVNPEFDNLIEKAIQSRSLQEEYSYIREAEKVAMSDSPLLVLWYESNYRFLKSNIGGFPNNGMQYHDYSLAYISKEKP